MRLRDLISSYDTLLPEPYLRRAEIVRLMPPDLHPEVIEFNLEALLKGDKRYNMLLMDLDRVKIYQHKEKMQTPEVIIKGAVLNPGTYSLYEGMKIKDLIFQAGNLTGRAYLDQALLSRVIAGEAGADNFKINFSPRRAMEGLSPDDILLQPFDKIYIREIPQYSQALERKVLLEGEFLFPGEYTFSQGERISSVIERAGGVTEEAYPFGAFFQRESVKNIQKSMVRDYIGKLEEDIFTLSAQASEVSLDKEQSTILNQTLNAKKQLLEKMKTAQPTGRMVVDLVAILTAPSSTKDFKLRSGDHLIVNKKPDYVNVLGEVYNPTAMFFLEDKTVGHYLNKVGGLTDNANEDQIYLVKANGTVISKRQEGFWGMASWDSENFRWTLGGFESLKVDLGDTIIVPKKVEKYPWLRLTKDITEILYRIAVTAGVIIVAY
ncbi:MAG: SLBB domain-containing protein [Desulfobacterales bacterium]|nr:SLBB domain-containing protein [Desulfobacterales bacterium]